MPNGKPVILAVDDKPELLRTLMGMLAVDYTVIAVTSAMAAIKALRTHEPALFLLDIEMPDFNGYELAALLRKHEDFKNTPIIFLTSLTDRENVLTAIQTGGSDYIVKPVDKEMLISKINQFLAQSPKG